jgi:hypothetical protein
MSTSSSYPVSYETDFAAHRSRLTTFFRGLLAWPASIVAGFFGIGLMFTWFFAAVALLFTGRYPAGLYAFNAKMVRFNARITAYMYLLTDKYPPLDLDEHPEYPVRVAVGPAKERYSRVKVLFRGIIGFPVAVMFYIYMIGLYFVALGTWFRVMFSGRQSAASHATMTRWLRYMARANAYFMYITEEWPPSAGADDSPAPVAVDAAASA